MIKDEIIKQCLSIILKLGTTIAGLEGCNLTTTEKDLFKMSLAHIDNLTISLDCILNSQKMESEKPEQKHHRGRKM